MRQSLEKMATYLLIGGFIAFGLGTIALLIQQTIQNQMSIEMTLIMVGVALIILGVIAAKLFGDIPDG